MHRSNCIIPSNTAIIIYQIRHLGIQLTNVQISFVFMTGLVILQNSNDICSSNFRFNQYKCICSKCYCLLQENLPGKENLEPRYLGIKKESIINVDVKTKEVNFLPCFLLKFWKVLNKTMMYWWINARNCILKTFEELCNFFMNNSRSWTLGLWQQSKDGRLPPMVSIWFVLSSQFTLIWYVELSWYIW